MTGTPRIAPASMAGCGLCALLAAAAFTGWNPDRRLERAWAARSHGPCASRHAQGKRAQATATSRRSTRRRCQKIRHHAAAGPPSLPRSVGPSTPTGTPGGGSSPTSPGGSSAPVTPPGSEERSTPPPSLPEVQVSAVEYHFTLSRTTVPAGKVIIEFVDNGQDEHNLNALGASGPPVATFATVTPKTVTRQTVELKPGSYTLFCSLAEHEAKGMKATLKVE